MNILHIVSNKVWGGGERYALDLCTRSVEDGHSVAVLTRGIPEVDSPFADAGIPLAKLPMLGRINMLAAIPLAKVLGRMAAPVVVHVHNFKDAQTAIRARAMMADPGKVRLVCTRHLVKPARTDRLTQSIYRGIDSLIFVSEAARETFLSTSPRVDESRISVIHNAVRIPVATHSDAGSHDEVTLAFIGRISPEKGLDVLLEALCSLGDVPLRLLVAGTGKGTDVMPLVRMSRRPALSGRVEWLGHVDDPLEVARRADIGIVPSVLAESFGLAIIEFMSCGVPVVATALGGPIEIITEGRDGLLVPASDPSALAAAIRRLATDRELCSRMGQEALATAGSRFAYEGFYRKIMNTYQS